MAGIVPIPARMPHRRNPPNKLDSGFVPVIGTPPGSDFFPRPHDATPLKIGPNVGLPEETDPANTPAWPPFAPYQISVNTPVPIVSQLLPATNWSPGTFPALPRGASVPFHIHPHLIYNPNNPSIPVLQWDILHAPEIARVFTGRHAVIPINLKAEAVFPVVKRVYIESDHPILTQWMQRWGPIIAESSKVTVRDVLDAIYEYFQQPLTMSDVRIIKSLRGNYTDLVYAAHRRVQESYELPIAGLRSGFKRVDALGGHRRFQGMRPMVYQDRTWKLFLGLLPGPVPRVYC